jgi:ribosomal protein S20
LTEEPENRAKASSFKDYFRNVDNAVNSGEIASAWVRVLQVEPQGESVFPVLA